MQRGALDALKECLRSVQNSSGATPPDGLWPAPAYSINAGVLFV